MSKKTFCSTVLLALFASLLLGAQPAATNLRMQKAVGAAVLKTGEEAVVLGSWVAQNGKYTDPLGLPTGGSDGDLRLRLTKDVPRDEALRRWKTFREEVTKAVKAEFGRDAERVLATMNVYPPSQLMGAVEDTADAASRFRELGTVPNLSFTGSANMPLDQALVEGLYGQGSAAWTQQYERTAGKLFFMEKGRVFTGTAELVNLIDGAQSFTAGGLGHTAEQWAEHGAGALALGDGRLVGKYLDRTERDLAKSRSLAGLETSGPWREELRALREELAANPRALSRLEPRIAEALRQATQAGQVLARLDGASGAQKAILKSFLRVAEDGRNAPKVINDALLKVPWGRLVEGAMLYVATAEISKAAAEKDLAKALSEASPFLLSLGPATLTVLAQEILTQARAGGYDLVSGYQDAFDLLDGLITMKGFEDAGFDTHTVSIDRLAERYREGQEEVLRNLILTLCSNATTKDDSVDAAARDALYARCMPVLLKAWQARREQWRNEAIALKASYGVLPFRLSYEPAPVLFEAAKGKALATVSYGFERGSDDRLDRLRGLLRNLYGAGAYADPVVEWTGGSPGTSLSTSRIFTFDRPGTYSVSAVRVLRLGGWPAAGGGPLAQQEIRQTGFVDVEVVGSAPNVAMAGRGWGYKLVSAEVPPKNRPPLAFIERSRKEGDPYTESYSGKDNSGSWTGRQESGMSKGAFGAQTVQWRVPKAILPGQPAEFWIAAKISGIFGQARPTMFMAMSGDDAGSLNNLVWWPVVAVRVESDLSKAYGSDTDYPEDRYAVTFPNRDELVAELRTGKAAKWAMTLRDSSKMIVFNGSAGARAAGHPSPAKMPLVSYTVFDAKPSESPEKAIPTHIRVNVCLFGTEFVAASYVYQWSNDCDPSAAAAPETAGAR
jgi:hypothetical protein